MSLKMKPEMFDFENFDARDSYGSTSRRVYESPGGGFRIVSYFPDPETLDPPELMGLLERLEWHRQGLNRRQSSPEPRRIRRAKREQTAELIGEVRSCLDDLVCEIRERNCGHMYYYDSDNIFAQGDLENTCPYVGLEEPEDFLLYWYANGTFPRSMDPQDIEKVRQQVQNQLDALAEAPETDRGLWQLRRDWKHKQLAQLDAMDGGGLPDDDDGPDDGYPICIGWLAFVPEDMEEWSPEDLSLGVEELEYKMEYIRESDPETGSDHPIALWQANLEQVKGVRDQMLDALNRRILERLPQDDRTDAGAEDEEEVPVEFRDHFLPAWVRGSELENAGDVIACWYLSHAFPYDLSPEKMLLVESELKKQMEALEAAEPEVETHDLWQFRWDLKTEQLDEIRTMMANYRSEDEDWEE